jgi:hypothetical protein
VATAEGEIGFAGISDRPAALPRAQIEEFDQQGLRGFEVPLC